MFHLGEHLRRHYALHLAGAQLSLVAALCLAFMFASASAWPAYAHLEGRIALARAARPGLAPLPSRLPPAATPAELARGEPALSLQDLSADAARRWNAANPIAKGPNPAARPFRLNAAGVIDEARAVECMTAAIYYEAGFESLAGRRAVAQVVINRLRNPLFPKSVCGVVFQRSEAGGCQFTFTCDGALGRPPQPEAWTDAREVAVAALHGYVMKQVGNATHYHADYVAPYWSPTLVKVAVVGQHIFYRWTGGLGLPPAFAGRYAGGETQGLKGSALDKLDRSVGKLALNAAPAATVAATIAAAPPPPTAVAAGKPIEAAPVAHAPDLVSAETLASNASALLKPGDLDWRGEPRRNGPPRIAAPSPDQPAF
jgi:spore germination cell wall hydrolase CwlJ-like protein